MNYTERLELPEGQWADLLTRLPTDRAQSVRVAVSREQALRGQGVDAGDPIVTDAIARAHLVDAHLKDYLAPERWLGAGDYGKADPAVTDLIQIKALELYAAWSSDALEGPKEPTPMAASTPTTGKASESEEPG